MASESETRHTASDGKVDIVLRSPDPTKLKDVRLSVPLRWNVDQLKHLIHIEHPRRPNPTEQVLIYGGKVLSDGETSLAEVLKDVEAKQGPCTMHLALRSDEPLTQSASAPNLGDMHHPSTSTSAPEVSSTSTAPSPMVALPIVMMNPVVSAAYNAALAAVYNPQQAVGGVNAYPLSNTLQPPTLRDQPQTGPSTSSLPHQNPQQQQPLAPAIAFFPLGIPVLVPAATAQNQGFQVGQTAAPIQHRHVPNPVPRHVHRRPQPQQPLGRRVHAGGNVPHGRGRGVVVYRFSLRGLIQLVLIIAVLYAYCSREHFFIGLVLFLFLYLFARPIRRLIHNHYNARDADGRPRVRGLLHEVLAILLTLITSLFPNWNANEGQGAPLVREIREDVPEENRVVAAAQNRPHVD